jgi:pyruvate,water dikinase
MLAMQAAGWLNEHLEEWLGEKNAADTLTQSVPHNVTSEMGLALLDVADAIRPHPEVVAFLRRADGDDFLDELSGLEGGRRAFDVIRAYLDQYGMRCVGEIDITRSRWTERPSLLVPVILSNIDNFEAGEGGRRFDEGQQQAEAKERDVLDRLCALPSGDAKALETKQMIERVRTFIGYREYPKYGMVSRYFLYKQALLGEAERLVQAGVLGEADEVFFLTFPEIEDVVRTQRADRDHIRERKDAFGSYGALTPPRVLTSEGEAIAGSYGSREVPAGALIGLPVSAGTIEGRARVILDIERADLEPGDILVTAFTDPSWSPLLVTVAGLVTEVGGLMTHGAVIAREYGLPAVVGVERATHLIPDGRMIRVNGTEGYVELLS